MTFMPTEDEPAGREWLVLGVMLLIAGTFMLHCYWDRSGRRRPYVARLLPGP